MALLKVFFTDNCVVGVFAQSHRLAMLLHCAQARLVLGKKCSLGAVL